MTTPQPPIDVLFDLVAAHASGELVCVARGSELHVYLQAGRIAWATDSALPFAFSRHLLANTSLTKETFQEVLEACRRDRLPLGETLIAWNVVSLAEIRAALEHQIEGALRTLAGCTDERTIFLERRREFASYDPRLTFDAEALVAEPASRRVIAASGRMQAAPSTGLLDRVRAEIPNAAWLEVLEGEAVVEHHPRDRGALVPTAVLTHTLLDRADIVAVRTARGTLLGVATKASSRTLWCRLDVDAAFGITLSTLCTIAGVEQLSGEPTSQVRTAVSNAERVGGDAPEVAAFLERAPEIDGVVVMEGNDVAMGIARGLFDIDAMASVVRRRRPVLDVMLDEEATAKGDLEALGYRLKSLVTGEAGVWCFGTELGGAPKRTLWIFIGRHNAQGLGWAYLTSLTRQLASLDGRDRAAAETG